MGIAITPLTGALGAELSGVDLKEDLSDDAIDQIRRAWLDHLVVFIRDQDLSPAQLLAFARRIGRPLQYPFLPPIDGHPEIVEVLKQEHERVNFGGIWHSDTSYLEDPPMATMLLARQLPPVGGDTLFANGYLAYESLSEGMRDILDNLQAVASSSLADVSRTREDRLGGTASSDQRYVASHPVVRLHPETGRRALYVNVAHTSHFASLTEKESRPILEYLFEHQIRPEFTCRFRWSSGALALWDNRCALHNPVNDYDGYRRSMLRITLAEDQASLLPFSSA